MVLQLGPIRQKAMHETFEWWCSDAGPEGMIAVNLAMDAAGDGSICKTVNLLEVLFLKEVCEAGLSSDAPV